MKKSTNPDLNIHVPSCTLPLRLFILFLVCTYFYILLQSCYGVFLTSPSTKKTSLSAPNSHFFPQNIRFRLRWKPVHWQQLYIFYMFFIFKIKQIVNRSAEYNSDGRCYPEMMFPSMSASKVLILYCDVVGDYGWRKEVHVPEKPAGCWVPQHWEAQRHTKRREKPCAGMDWKNKGQSMFLLPSRLFGVSLHPFTFPITFTYLEIQSNCGVIIQTFCSCFFFLHIFF